MLFKDLAQKHNAPPKYLASLSSKYPLIVILSASLLKKIAPPWYAVLLMNVELNLQSETGIPTYIAPPCPAAVLLLNSQPTMFKLP